MANVRLSLLYTTARPHLIAKVVQRWRESAAEVLDFELVIVTDDPIEVPLPSDARLIVNGGRRDCVTGWNLAATHARGDTFIQVSDDLFPPRAWDRKIITAISKLVQQRPDVVLNLLDERRSKKEVFHPVLTRNAYEKVGYLYPPDFESMYCDNWFREYHQKYSLYAVSAEVFWSHVHRTTHQVKRDAVMARHESVERYQRGRALLKRFREEHKL